VNEYHITCIHKPHHSSSHEHITHIGNAAGHWCLTRESAIQHIDSKQSAFYTVEVRSGRKMYIGVVRQTGRAPFLRTHADGVWNDNLLAQSECTPNCRVIE